MKKCLSLLLPLFLLTSCEPIVVNVATKDSTMVDVVYKYLENYWYSEEFYGDTNVKDAAIAQFISSITYFDVSQQLDPYTYIITNQPVIEDNSGKIGVVSTSMFNYPVVTSIVEGSPASAYLEIGDIIYGIGMENDLGVVDYHYISNTLYDVSSLLSSFKGKPGETIYYKIYRYEENTFNLYNFSFDLAAPFETRISSKEENDIDDTLTVKLSSFNSLTCPQFEEILKANEESENKKNNLVIDLRDNLGGSVSACVDCCDLLLEKDKEVLTIVGKNNARSTYKTKSKLGDYQFDKYVILVNENTASASEIMIKCLKYYFGDKLSIIGNQTYGKGLVTTTVSLNDKYSLQYLSGRWLDPSGEYMEYQTGINPNTKILRGDYFTLMSMYNSNIDFNDNIKIDTVSEVNCLLAAIFNAKYDSNIRIDGYFDANYESIVKQYQQEKNISQTGIIDEMTYLYLVYDFYMAKVNFDNNHINACKDFING